jgi:hypothetical protein
MHWRACLSDRGFDPLLRLVKHARQPNRPCTASIQAGLRRAALPYPPIVLLADARTPGAPGVIGEHSRSEAARECMCTDGVVICSPRFDDAASFAKPVRQMLVEALLGRSIHWIDLLTSSLWQGPRYLRGALDQDNTDPSQRRHCARLSQRRHEPAGDCVTPLWPGYGRR